MPDLASALDRALEHGRFDQLPAPASERDRLLALRRLHALHLAPLTDPEALRRSSDAAVPEVAVLKVSLESAWLAELCDAHPLGQERTPDDTCQALRALAADDRLPPVYRWVAKAATYHQLVEFLALEGGPDADFDDLVAVCQVGLSGPAKAELARNYWDEMGGGDPEQVHTTLHARMTAALGVATVPEDRLPAEALARQALGGLLATNHHLQPEMVGALGLTELQAGPRCRMVLKAFDRLGAPVEAYPFYTVHAEVDPHHGRDWLEHAVAPLVADRPEWGPRIVRGARWRKALNDDFFAWADRAFAQPLAA